MRAEVRKIVAILEGDGWVVSPKSVIEPHEEMTWMGKIISSPGRSVGPTVPSFASCVTLWLKLATKGYKHLALQRLIGKLIWLGRPGKGMGPLGMRILA